MVLRTLGPWTALLAALAMLALLGGFVTGRHGPVADATFLVMPYQMLVGDFARAGELLLWNPWTNGGSPDGLEPQFGAFSPLLLAAAWLGGGTPTSFLIFYLGGWCLAASGFHLLAMHLGASRPMALALGLAFATSGVFTGHASHANLLHGFSFLPWTVLLLDRALLRQGLGSARLAAAAGALWGLAALGGYPGVTLIHGLLLGGWALVRVLTGAAAQPGTAARPGAVQTLGLLTLLVLVGTLVLLPNHWGFAEGTRGYTLRSETLPRDVSSGWGAADLVHANPLEPRGLLTLVHPGIAPAGIERERGVLRYTDATSAGLHVGLGGLLLAALALGSGGRRAWALLILALLFLALALGNLLPLRAWLYDVLPPSRYLRHAAYFRIPVPFLLLVLAAEGARRLAGDPEALRRLVRLAWPIAIASAAISLAAHGLLSLPTTPWTVAWWLTAHGGLLAVGLVARGGAPRSLTWLLPCWMLAEAALAFQVNSPLVRTDGDRLARLRAEHVASIEPGPAGFRRELLAQTIDPAYAEAMLAGDHGPIAHALETPTAYLLDSANLAPKRAVLAGRGSMDNPFHGLIALSPPLLRQALGETRVHLADDAFFLPADEHSFEAYLGLASAGREVLLVHREGPAPATGEDLEAQVARALLRPAPARIERYTARELELVLDPPTGQPVWLYVTERWAPGWRAEVNGRPAEIELAGFLWRAVRLEAGESHVRFHYRPFGHPWLLLASWGTLLLVAASFLLRPGR